MANAPAREVERLYGLDLDEFIPARDATARRLREDGRKDAAAAVKALRKPSNAAWIVNRLSVQHPGVVSRLLETGQALRAEQLEGGGAKLRDAIAAERTALDRAMRNAEEIATHAGLASAATLDRVRETLHLAALDPAIAAEVEHGVLVREGRASGLLGSGEYVPRGAPPAPKQTPAAKPKAAAKAASASPARSDRAAERRAAAQAKRVQAAEGKAEAAGKELADAERELKRAQQRAERAREKAEAALAALEAARSATA
jgi:hypothetical protein